MPNLIIVTQGMLPESTTVNIIEVSKETTSFNFLQIVYITSDVVQIVVHTRTTNKGVGIDIL